MAIFSPGPTVGRISGNVGGTNFANSNNGPVLRQARAKSRNTNANQLIQQNKLKAQVLRWQALSDLDRQAWIQAARLTPIPNRLGVPRYLSGYQLFLRYNLTFEIDDPPTGELATTAVVVDFSSSVASGIDINFTGLPAMTAYAGFVFGRLLYRDTPTTFEGNLRKLGLATSLGTTTVSLDTIWQLVFPMPIEDQYIALEFRPFANSHYLGGNTRQILQTTA